MSVEWKSEGGFRAEKMRGKQKSKGGKGERTNEESMEE